MLKKTSLLLQIIFLPDEISSTDQVPDQYCRDIDEVQSSPMVR